MRRVLIHETHALVPPTLQRFFGVTRIARITGLDRTGVEVCSAIRPGGHVLQVSNGKGRTFERAAAAALSEAAELWAAENVRTHELKYGSRHQLTQGGLSCVWPDSEIAGEAEHLFMGWTRGTALESRREVWVPAHYVHCAPAGVFLGPRVFPWTTNGLAAHRTRDEAIRHGLREVIERDQLHFAFPDGWTPEADARRVAPPAELKPLIERICANGFQVELFDARASGDAALDVPVAAALLFDKDEGPISLTAGYGCAADHIEALESALLEAAQSRLTDIHGAREDVAKDVSGAGATMREWFKEPARAKWKGSRQKRMTAAQEVRWLTRRLAGAEITVVDLASKPLSVVRVIVTGFAVSELL